MGWRQVLALVWQRFAEDFSLLLDARSEKQKQKRLHALLFLGKMSLIAVVKRVSISLAYGRSEARKHPY
jgi:hypothetical protein